MEIQRPISRQPLPAEAKRVYKGIIFDVYQWEVDGYDGSKKTFEKLKRPDTVSIIAVTEDGKIMFTQEEQPGKKLFLSFPGGRIDEGEDILEAAKRELLEETGYEAKEWVLFDAVQPVSKLEWAVYTLIAKGCKKVAEQDLDGAEKIELQSVGFDEFLETATADNFEVMEVKVKLLEAKLDPLKIDNLKQLLLK